MHWCDADTAFVEASEVEIILATEAAFPHLLFPYVLVAIRASDVLGGEAEAEAALDDGDDDRGKLRRREGRRRNGRFWF